MKRRDLGECEVCGTPLLDNGEYLEFWGASVWRECIECPNEENHPEPWDPSNVFNLGEKPVVYVAGPYTHPDPKENTLKAIAVADELVNLGFVPYIPHLNHFWDENTVRRCNTKKSPTWWYEYDFVFLKFCDALYRSPGMSLGADNEEKLAKKLGIPVFHHIEVMVAAKMRGEI